MLNYSDANISLIRVDLHNRTTAGTQLFPFDCYYGGIEVICHRCLSANINVIYEAGTINIEKVSGSIFSTTFKNREYQDAFMESLSIAGTTLINFCRDCGFWYGEYVESVPHYDEDDSHRIQICGCLQKFKEPDNDLKREFVRYMARNRIKIDQLSPKLFEVVIGEFLRVEWKPSEIRHVGSVGGKGDGGIDFILIDNDIPWMVQVKHRLSLKNEGVKFIRELNGVLFRDGMSKGIFVTSAHSFTKGVNKEINKAKENVPDYEMILVDRFEIERWLNNISLEETPWLVHLIPVL
ncbi:MAG: restriction endonuclease [Nitrospirota bacterium]